MPTQTHPLDVTGPVQVQVRNPSGSIVVDTTAATGHRVELSARSEDDLDGIEVRGDASQVLVKVPNKRFGRQPKVHVVVHVPARSTAELEAASASIETRGELQDVEASAASGSITLERVVGAADAESVSGAVRVAMVGGELAARSVSGAVQASSVDGACTLSSVSGSIELGHGSQDVEASTVSGGIRVGSVVAGKVDLSSTSGSLQVGVPAGTLAWLDLGSMSGAVRSDLDDGATPAPGESAALEIRAHTTSGSIRVERSTPVGV